MKKTFALITILIIVGFIYWLFTKSIEARQNAQKEIGWQISNTLIIKRLESASILKLSDPLTHNFEGATNYYKVLAKVDIRSNKIIKGMYQMLPQHPDFDPIDASYWDNLKNDELKILSMKLGYKFF